MKIARFRCLSWPLNPFRVRVCLSLLVVALVQVPLAAASSGAGVPGELSQLPGAEACLAEGDSGGACTDALALAGLSALAVSPGGQNLYSAAYWADAVDVFSRDSSSGALSQQACFSSSYGDCTYVPALQGASGVAISPDGRSVYATASLDGSLLVFTRTSAGALTYSTCFSEDGSGGDCTQAEGLTDAYAVVVSPDGANVYVTSSYGVAIFQRSASGALTQLPLPAGCLMQPPADPTDPVPDCSIVENGIDSPASLMFSPTGEFVYVAGGSAIAAFARSASGALTELSGTGGCITADGSGGACASLPALDEGDVLDATIAPNGRDIYAADYLGDAVYAIGRAAGGGLIAPSGPAAAVDGPSSLVISPDGQNLYVTATPSDMVAAYAVGATGALSPLPSPAGCINLDGSNGCTVGVSLAGPQSLGISPDGSSVYVGTVEGGSLPYYTSIDVFQRLLPSFTIRVKAVGRGWVISHPAGINCPHACSDSLTYNNAITLRAKAAKGWRFSGWSGGGCSGTRTCTVTMSAAQTVTAAFKPTLTVIKQGRGTIAHMRRCGVKKIRCTATLQPGKKVKLKAIPARGWLFSHWAGACKGVKPVCIIKHPHKPVRAKAVFAR